MQKTKKLYASAGLATFVIVFLIAFLTNLPSTEFPTYLQIYIAARSAVLYSLGTLTGIYIAPSLSTQQPQPNDKPAEAKS